MKFYAFHLMPYAALDPDYDKQYNAAWVTLPNSYYDPRSATRSTTAISTNWSSPTPAASTAYASTSITRTPTG